MATNTEETPTEDTSTDDTSTDEQQTSSSDKGQEKLRTQAEVDKIVKDRLWRAQQTFQNEQKILLEKAKKYDELEEQNKSELQKLQDLAAAEKTRAEQLDDKLRAKTLQTEILKYAALHHAIDADVLQLALEKQKFEVDDDGQPIGVEAAVTELLAAKPYLVGKQTSSGKANGGYRGTNGKDQLTQQDLISMSPEEIDKAHSEGRFDSLYGIK